MSVFRMSHVQSPEFNRACTCCQMAFGCMLATCKDGTIAVVAFNPGDDGVIIDTLMEVGSALVAVLTLQEALKWFC